MIASIVRKEFIELSRDGRFHAILLILGLLLLLGLSTGLATETSRQAQIVQAEVDDAEVFLDQGEKNPHTAAHFSRMAYKPVAPLASFDPGISSYLGQVIWLEAHYRNPAMFRAAEDAPELTRLEHFSVAGVLTLALPLMIILMGYSSIAGERERGTLRQLIGSGTRFEALLLGKFLVIAGVVLSVLAIAILLPVVFSLFSLADSAVSSTDVLWRGVGLFFVYGLYAVALIAITLLVSSLVREARTALLLMLGIWVLTTVGVPRVVANLAEQVYPSPDAESFWEDTRASLVANRPDSQSEEYVAVQRRVVERALGRELRDGELESLAIDRDALRLEVSEVIDATAYNAEFDALFENYEKQAQLRRALSIFSPTIALQHLSRSYSGTDIVTHEHFSTIAEQQRNNIIRSMNEDMMFNAGEASFGYLSPPEFWATVPEFSYQPPSVEFAWRSSAQDLFILFAWSALAFAGLYWVSRHKIRV